jgi:hypothetical protein
LWSCRGEAAELFESHWEGSTPRHWNSTQGNSRDEILDALAELEAATNCDLAALGGRFLTAPASAGPSRQRLIVLSTRPQTSAPFATSPASVLANALWIEVGSSTFHDYFASPSEFARKSESPEELATASSGGATPDAQTVIPLKGEVSAAGRSVMKLERWLQISLAALSLLGTTLLGLAEGNSLAALVMLIAAPAAVLFSDSLGWIRLTRPLANLGALAAVGYTFFDFLRHGTQNQLLAIANLLLYLQLVLLFQEKNLRIYWQLLVLSLLEVVVAGAMNLSFHFGFLLVVYMAIALAALALLSTIREARLWSPRSRPSP